jgi:hypothetical protein
MKPIVWFQRVKTQEGEHAMKKVKMDRGKFRFGKFMGLMAFFVSGHSLAQIRSSSPFDFSSGIITGTHCARDSVFVRTSDAGMGLKKLTIQFAEAEAVLEQGVSAQRASCIIRVPANLLGGTRLTIKSLKASGFVGLNEDSIAGASIRFAVHGLDTSVKSIKFDGLVQGFDDLRFSKELLKSSSLSTPCMRQNSRGLLAFNAALMIQERQYGNIIGDPVIGSDFEDYFGDQILNPISNGFVMLNRVEVIYKQEVCL